MADIVYSADDVVAEGGSATSDATSGDAIGADQGSPVYRDSADGNKLKKAQATSVTTAAAIGILLNLGADGQPVKIATSGVVDFGGGLTQGVTYVVSAATAGGIAPDSDIISPNVKTILGVALDSSRLELNIQAPGVAL